jgi:hypothetical protein
MDLTLETDILRVIDGAHISVMCETAFRYPGVSVCCLTVHRATFFTSVDLNPALGSAVLLNFQKRTIGGKSGWNLQMGLISSKGKTQISRSN